MSSPIPDPTRVDRFLADATADEATLRSALARALCPRDVAWALAEHCGRALGLLDCVVYLAEANSGTLQQCAAWGYKQAAPGIVENPISLHQGEGIVGTCAATRVPVLVADCRLDSRYVVDDQARLSELAVPLLDGDRLFGVIDSEHPQPDAYRSAHIRGMLRLGRLAVDRLLQLTGTV